MTRERIENPVTGERIEFRRGTDANDSPIRFDYYLEPGGFATGRIDHVHPRQEERFEVRSGRLGVRIAGDEWTATPGTRFSVLPETPHTVWNDGDDEVHAVIEIRPGSDIGAFFETVFALAREGKTNRWGIPGPLGLAVLVDEFHEDIYFDAVPFPIQRAFAGVVAPVGRLAGYRASDPRRSEPEP
ncbi:cupin domain-containing protein [Halalkalicoccus tibetensis]|uniref:Cupin domain-containing protein n=1 Tax=Halalkalicoccus tibetensis TaxID=175632 RepID=A0ABD5V663_9EURY